MRLPALVTIISVPSWLNSSQSAFISSCTVMLATFGFFLMGALLLLLLLLPGVEEDEQLEDEAPALSDSGQAWLELGPKL